MTDKYQAGESYADNDALATGLLDDLRAVGAGAQKDIKTLLEVVQCRGKAVDDKEMIMERLIEIMASLPITSKARRQLSNNLIDTLWDTLQHPPLSYMGDKFKYRTPDGSFNNILFPQLGAAGGPYAKMCRSEKKLQGVRPDPGLLFDLLMNREKGKFKENLAGISSMLFYHASIIIHDIFRSNRKDANISDSSSYLDLAPLYGSSLEDQLQVRTMHRGLLKPDTFHEKRLINQPPGVNVILVLYSRFHNYVADILLKINEGGRFSLAPFEDGNAEEKTAAITKQDNDLFQTARLIVCGLYVNICLHDYLRGITNTHHSTSDWTLDPRSFRKQFDEDGVPHGIGNQASAELSLLYRFHPAISLRDEKWLEDNFKKIFSAVEKPLEQITPVEFLQGLAKSELLIPEDPSKREFGDLKRGSDGKFQDGDLVEVLKKSIEDPAGSFGARMVPKALRVVEIMSILQSRKWQVASLNEFRTSLGLKKHETMEDLNPDPDIADILRKLYNHPDMVELYPGLFLEDGKPRMDPGCGSCAPYTVSRAVLADAINLVRADRFYTIDYTSDKLTNWGMQEVQQDYKTLGGSMFYRLIQRAVPGWFAYNSLYVMQPMFTRKMNETIARQFDTIGQYTLVDPAPPRNPVVVFSNDIITQVLKDQASFKVPWARALNDLFPGKKDYSGFMLGGDFAANAAQRTLVHNAIYGFQEMAAIIADFVANVGNDCLRAETLNMTKGLDQIDILRDVAIPVNARLLADLFSLDIKSAENPDGTLSVPEIFKNLLDVRTFGFNNNDPGLEWNRRRWAHDGAVILTKTTEIVVTEISKGIHSPGIFQTLVGGQLRRNNTKENSLRWYGRRIVTKLLAAGKTTEEVSDICWLTALAGVGAPVGVFADVLNFFMQPENHRHWESIQDFAAAQNPKADQSIREYVLEAQRLTSLQRDVRICAQSVTIGGTVFNRGDAVILFLGEGGRDPKVVPNPKDFQPGRPSSAYISFGYGPHECLGKEITYLYVTGLIKLVAGLKNLRPAPGEMGELKQIMVGTERCYLSDNWSYLTFDPTTWKLHYDGYGKGVSMVPTAMTATQQQLDLADTVPNEQTYSITHTHRLNDLTPQNHAPLEKRVMNSRSSSFSVQSARLQQRPSFSSRLSFAISNAEQGQAADAPNDTEHQIEEEIAEIKRYEDFTTIDWVQDASKEQLRRRIRQKENAGFFERGGRAGLRYTLWESYEAIQGWIVVTLIGATIGVNAAFLNIITEWLSDVKLGYCTTAFYLNESFCCWGEDNGCDDWHRWSSLPPLNYILYILFATIFALTSATLVKSFAPYAAGSGISEIKCIIAGFVMKGFLGFWTLLIKSIALPLAIASGLSVGKEGPSVHYAVCTGNVISRFFEKYKRNASKTREILSACAAAGVAVAFGSPIGGVIFSLEEMSSYFPLKTMWRSYFCALVATAVLAAMNPFRTGQLVMFQVHYDRSWHFFEVVFFLIIGLFGGLYGAFVIKWNLRVQAFRKKYLTQYPLLEATLLATFTAILCYPNMFLRIDMTESMEILFLECEGAEDYNGLCEKANRWRMIISLTIATILRIGLVIISYGCKVPAGIFVPSMAIGASFGRTVGILVQALHETYPNSVFFAACEPDVPCITPGTYAFLGAGAALSGIMHITVSVVVIMFELTGALTYILPTMIVVGVTKAVSELFGKGGIADRMIWFNGFPFLDNKEEHTFGVPVSQVMTIDLVALPTTGLAMKDVEQLLHEDKYQGFPIVEDRTSKILVGYIGRTELRYAIDRVKRDRSIGSDAKCYFGTSAALNPMTSTGPATTFEGIASSAVDFSRFIDSVPVTVHPRLPLETVMELFRKIGPRVILIEYHGKLTGLVTVKDCLKYQFKVEASENPRDDSHLVESQERLWGVMKKGANWVSDQVHYVSRGRIRLGSGPPEQNGNDPSRRMMDGTEDLVDEGLELEDR